MDRPREPLPTRVEGLPELPPAYHDALDAGLGALGIRLLPAARAAIDGHVRLLVAWNRSINLTAVREPPDIAVRHVVDSLAALPLLAGVRDGIVDLGSGGGYPGLPLAAVLADAPVMLVDSIAKKAAFLATVVEALDLTGRVTIENRRAESLAADTRHRERWGAVTARAVGALAELVELGFPLLSAGGRLVAWKRGDVREEIGPAKRAVAAMGGGAVDVQPVEIAGLADHRLVVVTKHGRTPAAYPREPAQRRREPW